MWLTIVSSSFLFFAMFDIMLRRHNLLTLNSLFQAPGQIIGNAHQVNLRENRVGLGRDR